MRVRVRYSKLGRIRFVSAIDMGRIWERSLRRADLPIAYSEGFSPHPKVSFPDALTLGYASTGEYAELTFVGHFEVPRAMTALTAALPDGMGILDALEVPDGAPRLSTWLQASMWDIRYPQVEVEAVRPVVGALLEAERIDVDRDRKGQITTVDLRPAIAHLRAHREPDAVVVRAVVHHSEPPMRPQEIHRALATSATAAAAATIPDFPPPALVTRVAQGRASDDGLIEAISGDLVPAAAPAGQKATT